LFGGGGIRDGTQFAGKSALTARQAAIDIALSLV
jgi:hypothetical protein